MCSNKDTPEIWRAGTDKDALAEQLGRILAADLMARYGICRPDPAPGKQKQQQHAEQHAHP